MSEEVKKHLFEPFYTTKPIGEGTGLGLSVCHGILKSHGGKIEVESAPQSGTTFTLVFPNPATEAQAA
jgi:two-component system NtrC family sensor kinase